MSRPIIRIHDLETNEVIDREMSAAEFKVYEADKAAEVAKQSEVEAKETAKAAIFDRLGLTADEAKLILG